MKHIGRKVIVHDRVESTNLLALSLAAEEDSDGVVLLAREQTGGRGQHGRSWSSPPDTSVLMSAIVEVPPHLCRPVVLTAWAAVSVCEMIVETTGLSPVIKWPNDVLIGGRKVCGILIEMRQRAVIGIGLNVRQTREDFMEGGLPDATSLRIESEKECLEPRSLALKLCERLDAIYGMLAEGDFSELEESWSGGLRLMGRDVIAECHDGERRGIVERLSFDGVALRTAGGGVILLQPETIRHIRLVSS